MHFVGGLSLFPMIITMNIHYFHNITQIGIDNAHGLFYAT